MASLQRWANSSKFLTAIKSTRLLAYLVSAILILPSFIWILLDKSVWWWDESWYAQESVQLFDILIHSPGNWLTQMANQYSGTRAPLISWVGQFFVPLGIPTSIDVALLLFMLLTQYLTLVLIFKAIQALTGNKTVISIGACLVVASAPLFVGMGHLFMVEPIQTLAVSWFIYLMCTAPRQRRSFLILQLAAASSFAMLTKFVTPLYCVGPGSIVLLFAFLPKKEKPEKAWWKDFGVIYSFILALVLGIGAFNWYYLHFKDMYNFATWAASGSAAEYYGKRDNLFNKLLFWLDGIRISLFVPIIAYMGGLLLLGGVIALLIKRGIKKYFHLCAIISIIQIGAILVSFSVSINEDIRYSIALILYFALLFSWSLVQVNLKLLTGVALGFLILQFILVQGQALGLKESDRSISNYLSSYSSDRSNIITVTNMVNTTCFPAKDGYINYLGVDLSWFNAVYASYTSSKNRLLHNYYCPYTNLGWAETNADIAYENFINANPRYFVTVNPDLYKLPDDPFNRVSLSVLEKIKSNSDFRLISTSISPKILIYQNMKAPTN